MKRFLILFGYFLNSIGLGLFASFLKRIRDIVYTGYHSKSLSRFSSGKIEYPAEQIIGHRYISVGRNSLISKNIILTAFDKRGGQVFSPQIIIGDNCIIGENMHITAVGNITIGNNVLTGRYCLITDNSHGLIRREELNTPPILRELSHKDVSIGDNVWIGDSVCILPGVSIGRGCIIGAGSIVTKDIPDNCVAVGNPAKIIKSFSSEL